MFSACSDIVSFLCSAAVMSIQRVHESYPMKIKILRTGAYIKFSTGGLLSGVLGSHSDGKI